MTLDYALKEGFIELRRYPMDEMGARRFALIIGTNKEFKGVETPDGVFITDLKGVEDALMIDADTIGKYSVEAEVALNIPILTHDEIRAIQE